MPALKTFLLAVALTLFSLALGACAARPGEPLTRSGDEIMVAGQLFHTGAPVVLWTDPGGYDAYRVERRFVPFAKSSWAAGRAANEGPAEPNRYSLRGGLTDAEIARVRGGGWDLATLQKHVDQFVIHYDAAGASRSCFRILHDIRGLSVHFMLDADGTIYQTLDVKERAWHAGEANDRSVGIEIANIGAYAEANAAILQRWYGRDELGTRLTLPPEMGGGGLRTPDFIGRPDRPDAIVGTINGHQYRQYDLTPQQYDSLIKLTAALCTVLPRIRCDYPRDEHGQLITRTLTPQQLKTYSGLLGHYHVDTGKIDPGPALQWDKVVDGARRLMPSSEPLAAAKGVGG